MRRSTRGRWFFADFGICRKVDRLNALIGDLLRYSRPAPLKPERADLSALVVEVAEMSASPEQGRWARVNLELQPNVEVMADSPPG